MIKRNARQFRQRGCCAWDVCSAEDEGKGGWAEGTEVVVCGDVVVVVVVCALGLMRGGGDG